MEHFIDRMMLLLSLAGLGIIYYTKQEDIKEHFLGMGIRMVAKAQKVPESQLYTIPGTYQASVPPRFDTNHYGALMRHRMPKEENRAAPANSAFVDATFAEGFTDKKQLDALGNEITQPVIYDRFMYSNSNNRNNRGVGVTDLIRGDLPITPGPKGWFSTAADVNDLQYGALSVMGGLNNDTTQQLMALKSDVSAGTEDVAAGIRYTQNMRSLLSNAGGDVTITAFP